MSRVSLAELSLLRALAAAGNRSDPTLVVSDKLVATIDALIKAHEALAEVEEYLDQRADVEDGSYGEPRPNKAMQLLQEVRAATARVQP